MSYLNDRILASLKKARKAKGLSQRELSTKSGVPQSHLSKIENGAVDLRVSSLIAIARTLDLELELVPRKAVPAVQSIVRKASGIGRVLEAGNFGYAVNSDAERITQSQSAYNLDNEVADE